MTQSSRQKLSERSPFARALIALVFLASVAVVASAERDIQRRPAEQLRGGKLLWRVVSLNALGAAGYFRFGRRRSEEAR